MEEHEFDIDSLEDVEAVETIRSITAGTYSIKILPKTAIHLSYTPKHNYPIMIVPEGFTLEQAEQRRDIEMDIELKSKVQNYVNCFRSVASSVIQTNAGQIFDIIPFEGGVLMRIEQKPGITNADNFYNRAANLKDAFQRVAKDITQIVPTSKIAAEKIEKTDIYVSDYIYIVKGEDEKFWTEDIAKKEVKGIAEFAMSKNKK